MNNKILHTTIIGLFLAFNLSVKAQNVQLLDSVEHVVFLVGDAGEPESKTAEVFDILLKQVKPIENKSTIIFLGDNIYPGGIPNKNEKGVDEAKNIILYQLNRLKQSKAKTYYIPGNHDWNKGHKNGLSHVINEEKLIEKTLDNGDSFIPSNGCPGPVDITISDNLVLIAIDTQWWLHQYEKSPVKTGDCKEITTADVINNLKDILADNKDKNILIVGHHPLMSKGDHGGFYTLKNHIFPLTNLNKNLYIPLPIIGSIYPFYRSNIGNIQDIAHPEYQYMIKQLQKAFKGYDNLIYAAGHEHNLQYYYKNNQHFIVSGSGSKTSHVKKLKLPNFSAQHKGFFKLYYLKDGSVFMETYGIVNGKEKLLFQKIINDKKEIELVNNAPIIDTTEFPKTMIVRAGKNYEAGKVKSFLLGKHYRAAWNAPIEVPVIDIHEKHGGLTPLKKGGGMQTISLRLSAPDGNQYVFRSIQKDPSAALPDNLKNTAAAEVVQDQISTSHPYGAFVIPKMAEAAGILHSHPEMVVIPDDPHLLQYQDEFANQLMLYEQRAANDVSGTKNFGYSPKAISSPKLIKKILNNHNVTVDERELARNRLFDMFIGDWDRHEDQWRWVEYTCNVDNHEHCEHLPHNNKYYIPVPRDRDQAFVKFDGLIPRLAGRKWVVRKLQHFDYDIRDIAGMNFNARFLDRSFLNRLNKQEWLDVAKEIQTNLTDQIIIAAIKQWPDTIYKLDGAEITAKLISRKNKLHEFAERYYDVLAKTVDVIGSNKREYFEVVRLNDSITSVKIYSLKKGVKGNLFYQRDFKRSETKEIRLYGLAGKDEFDISGEVNKGILVRIIGGTGNDAITDVSNVKGMRKKTKYYDTKKEDNLVVCEKNNELKNLVSNEKMINHYDRKAFKYDLLIPNVFLGFNIDDGLFLGGGATYTHHGFRKEPYSHQQKFVANRALKTNSFNIIYGGKFIDVIKKLDLEIDASVNAPKSTTNFYGLGNETVKLNENDKNFHLVRFNEIIIESKLVKNIGKFNEIKFGPTYQFIDVEESENRFITSPAAAEYVNSTTARNYLGFETEYSFSNVDNKAIPTRGIAFHIGGSWNLETREINNNFGRLESQFSMHIPLPLNMVYSTNIKGVHIINDFEFYQAATLGAQNRNHNNGDLRGYRRDRFSGRSSLALNQEIHFKLFDFKTYLFPGQLGLLAFYDVGRVWSSGVSSNIWHKSGGGGLWISPYDKLVINASYAISEEEELFILKVGFLF